MYSNQKRLEAIAENHSGIKRVQTIPGVGPRIAEVIVTTLDDVSRFKNARQVSSYIGLVPRQYQSGETDRNGRITKRGSRILRTILRDVPGLACNTTTGRVRPTTASKAVRKLARRKRRAPTEGWSALARKIAVVSWAMLRNETDWDAEKARRNIETTIEENPSKVTP